MGRPNKHGLPPGLRKNEHGEYLIDLWYLDGEGKRRRIREKLGVVPLVRARDILAKRRVELLDGKMGKGTPQQVTVAQAFARYLEWAEAERPRSMRFRRVAAERMRVAFGKRRLRDLTPWLLERYKRDRLKEGYAPATINLDLAATKHMLTRAAAWGWLGREQAHTIRDEVKLLKADNTRVRYLTPDEKARLLAACPPDLRELVVGALNLGARAGELVSLTWDRVDLEGGTVMIRRTKTENETRIHVNPSLREALESAAARRRNAFPFVFTTKAGRAWHKSWLHEQFRLATDAAGLKDFRFHDLRHHFASTLAQRGIGLQRIQKLLGHSRSSTTERYAHLAPDADEATLLLEDSLPISHLEAPRKPAKKK